MAVDGVELQLLLEEVRNEVSLQPPKVKALAEETQDRGLAEVELGERQVVANAQGGASGGSLGDRETREMTE